jgi:hypothetical protein
VFKTDFKQTIFSRKYTRMSVAVVSSSWVATSFDELPNVVQAAVMKYWNEDDFYDEFINNKYMNGSAKQQLFLNTLKEVERYRLTTDRSFAWALVTYVRTGNLTETGLLSKIQMAELDEEEKKKEEEEERYAAKKKEWLEEYKKTHTLQPNKPASTSMITKGMLREVMTEFMPRRRPVPVDDKYKCDLCHVVLSSHGALYNHTKSKAHQKALEQQVSIPTLPA